MNDLDQAGAMADSGLRADGDFSGALMEVIRVLGPLSPEGRRRIVDAAMVFFGDSAPSRPVISTSGAVGTSDIEGDYTPTTVRWMEQNHVSSDELDMVFQFKGGGAFEVHDAPGKSKKEKTLNAYILVGLGTYLATGERDFSDSAARACCETLGCFDPTNHATYLKSKGNEFTGDKSNGYSLSSPGIKRGAALVKELAGGAR